jgi:metal-dependent HD superfamily phosphatase/phosphodiesterase
MDHTVKEDRLPRADRTEFHVYGVPLTPYWQRVLKEIYEEKDQRHRFDIIQCILIKIRMFWQTSINAAVAGVAD